MCLSDHNGKGANMNNRTMEYGWHHNKYRDKISVYLQRHPRAGEDTHLTSTQELVKIHNMCEDISI